MPNATLSLSNVINVSILPTPTNLNVPNINTAALFTLEQPSWLGVQASKIYTNPSDVLTDFGAGSKTFAIAVSFFSQLPNPLGSGGYLVVIPRSLAASVAASLQVQDINYRAVTTGVGGNSVSITYSDAVEAGLEVATASGSAITVTIDSGETTAAQVLAAILASAPCVALVNASITGVSSAAQVTAGSTNLAGGSASGTETVQAALARTLNVVYYFGVLVDEEYTSTPAILRALAAYVQAIDRMLFYASSTAGDYAPGGLLDLVRQASMTQTRLLYYKTATALDTQVMAAAYAARALSTDFSGSKTVQTMHLKRLAGVVPDQTVDQTTLVALQASGADAYVSVAGIPGVFSSGLNGFFDEVYNEKWLKFAMQTAGFNYLAGTSTKIPQTEQGMEGLKNVYRKVCEQGISNGYIGPGSWDSSDLFGDPLALVRCINDHGYYVYSQPITAQLLADRVARKAPLIQIALKSAGAIHSSNVIVNVGL